MKLLLTEVCLLVTIRKYLTNTEEGIEVFSTNPDTDTKSIYSFY